MHGTYNDSAFIDYLGNASQSTIFVNSSLNRTDADVTILPIFLDAFYSAPVDDLLYQASASGAEEDPYGYGSTVYPSDKPVGVMGCMEQHQFCRADTDVCTAMTGYWDAGDEGVFDVGSPQLAIAGWLYASIIENALWHMVGDLNGEALLANIYVTQGNGQLSASMPKGTWQKEVLAWHQFIMARMQKLIVEVAAGPQIDEVLGYSDADIQQFMEDWDSDTLSKYNVCKNVKVMDSNFYSWNIIGVVVIILVGLIIIFISLSIEKIASLVQKHIVKRWRHKREDWVSHNQVVFVSYSDLRIILIYWHQVQDHAVQLQRHGFEKSVGHVSWIGHSDSVPTTKEHEKFTSISRHSVAQLPGVYSKGMPSPQVVEKPVSPGVSLSLAPNSPSLSPNSPRSHRSGYFQSWQGRTETITECRGGSPC